MRDIELSDVERAWNADSALGWRTVDLPHDWSIEGEFSADSPTGQGGWLPAGVGWYAREFDCVPRNGEYRRVFLQSDGIMSHSTVYVNGHEVGTRANGYASFCYDITDFVRQGKNLIAIRVDNSVQPASRWYTGSGINRRLRLIYTNDVRIPYQGVFAHYDDSLQCVCVEASVCNSSKKVRRIRFEAELAGCRRQSKRLRLEPGQELKCEFRLNAVGIERWSPDSPLRTTVSVRAKRNGHTLDEECIDFGIRSIRYDNETGFWLNGRNMKMYGVCLHSDAGAYGTVTPGDVWVERLLELKKLGANAIRWAHNIPDPVLLDICDSLGFLVMVESFDTWEAAKAHAEKGYNIDFRDNWRIDTEDMVRSARNHPCVVIYSVGNEIRDNLNNEDGFRKYRQQQDLIHELDPTRPVTMALFRPNSSGVYRNGFAEMMDVVGQNYRVDELKAYHEAHPEKVIIGTENTHDIQSWLMLRDDKSLCGQFLWTGIEYLGEAEWPQVSWNTALMDITGAVKPLGLQRMSWWTQEPMVAFARRSGTRGGTELLADWTPEDTSAYRMATVEVYSNCQEVELILNGRSLGRKAMATDARPAIYSVAYESGEMVAKGYIDGEECAEYRIVTAGEPYALRLECSPLSCKVTARVVDRNGNLCPNAVCPVTFSVLSGPAEVACTDNADPFDHSSHKSNVHSTWHGSCVAYVNSAEAQSVLTASAPGLQSDTIAVAKVTNR